MSRQRYNDTSGESELTVEHIAPQIECDQDTLLGLREIQDDNGSS